jgi:hypothetical protein
VETAIGEDLSGGAQLTASATVRSSTAQPVTSNPVTTRVTSFDGE